MEPLAKVIVYPILGIVYVALRCLSRPHSSLPSFMPAFPYTVSYWRGIFGMLSLDIHDCKFLLALLFGALVVLAAAAGSCFILKFLGDVNLDDLSMLVIIPWVIGFFLSRSICIVSIALSFHLVVVLPFMIVVTVVVTVLFLPVLVLSIDCLVYFLSLLSFFGTRAAARFIVFGLKNRRACQFLLALAAVVLGVTNAKVFAAIPISFGIILSVPDLEPDPWVDFKLRFAKFLEANMDAESVDAFLHSKSSMLVSFNEMMPELGPVRSITAAASFELQRRSFRPEDHEHFNVEAEYRIGLGSITTSTRGDVIDVHIFTPFSGVRKRTIANTARSRYNLDMSARFWKEHPHVGILNKAFKRGRVFEVGELHCVGVDEWIKLCGSEYHVFEEYDFELGTYLEWNDEDF